MELSEFQKISCQPSDVDIYTLETFGDIAKCKLTKGKPVYLCNIKSTTGSHFYEGVNFSIDLFNRLSEGKVLINPVDRTPLDACVVRLYKKTDQDSALVEIKLSEMGVQQTSTINKCITLFLELFPDYLKNPSSNVIGRLNVLGEVFEKAMQIREAFFCYLKAANEGNNFALGKAIFYLEVFKDLKGLGDPKLLRTLLPQEEQNAKMMDYLRRVTLSNPKQYLKSSEKT